MKIFYFDAHVGTHSELMYVFDKIYGNSAAIEGWLISDHSYLIGRQQDRPEIINAQTWRMINENLIDAFWERYKEYLKTFDLFIVSYPAVFSMLYARTNKPILIYNAVRYDMPFCWSKDIHSLNQFNSYLSKMHQEKRVAVISNNLADHDYFQAGTHGVPSVLIPTIGAYAKLKWQPTTDNALIYSGEDHLKIKMLNLYHEIPWAHIAMNCFARSVMLYICLMMSARCHCLNNMLEVYRFIYQHFDIY